MYYKKKYHILLYFENIVLIKVHTKNKLPKLKKVKVTTVKLFSTWVGYHHVVCYSNLCAEDGKSALTETSNIPKVHVNLYKTLQLYVLTYIVLCLLIDNILSFYSYISYISAQLNNSDKNLNTHTS